MQKSAGVLFSGLVAGLVLAGCSPAVTGGDTKCKDFIGQDEKTQNEAVAKMLKDEKGTDAAQLEITGTRLAVQTFCQTMGSRTPRSRRPRTSDLAQMGSSRNTGQRPARASNSSGLGPVTRPALRMNPTPVGTRIGNSRSSGRAWSAGISTIRTR